MEELQVLIGMVSDLPSMAIWVLIGFFAYKTIIVGSIFGVIKLAITSLHSWSTTPKETLNKIVEDRTTVIDRLTIKDAFVPLINQLERLPGMTTSIGSDYIHIGDVRWLAKAIDEKIERDKTNPS